MALCQHSPSARAPTTPAAFRRSRLAQPVELNEVELLTDEVELLTGDDDEAPPDEPRRPLTYAEATGAAAGSPARRAPRDIEVTLAPAAADGVDVIDIESDDVELDFADEISISSAKSGASTAHIDDAVPARVQREDDDLNTITFFVSDDAEDEDEEGVQ
jgi:hypothetical protein